MKKKDKTTISSEELVSFPEIGIETIHARIDTGAAISSFGVKKIEEKDNHICCTLPNQQTICFDKYTKKVIKSSFGHIEERYAVRLLVNVHGRKVRTNFTLADRSKMKFPVLIGRNLLKGRFIVDVGL